MPDRDDKSNQGVMPDRVSVAGIASGAIAVVAAIALSLAIAFVAVNLGHGGPQSNQRQTPPRIEGNVKLQASPALDIDRFRDEKRRLINEYGWTDRDRTFARVPIERAMSMLVLQAAKGPAR
jgi:hypothetical protein